MIYLLMARWFSGDASPAVHQLMEQALLAPLYPLLLSVIGGGESVLRVRLATTFMLLGGAWFYRCWLRSQGVSTGAVFGLVVLFLFLPTTLMLSQEIVSEMLYLMLSLASLWTLSKAEESGLERLWLLAAILVGFTVASRTVGLSLVLALAIWWLRHKTPRRLLLLGVAVLPYGIWLIYKRTHGLNGSYQSAYVDQIASGLLSNIADQAMALLSAWLNLFTLIPYWPQQLLSVGVGVAAAVGLGIRLRALRLDALYVLIYLGIIALWPYPKHALRFLFPVMPLLLFYAWAAFRDTRSKLSAGTNKKVSMGAYLLVAVALMPSLVYIAERWWAGQNSSLADYSHTRRWFTRERLPDAIYDAQLRETLTRSQQAVAKRVPEHECVWFIRPQDIMFHGRRQSYEPPAPSVSPEQFQMNRCNWFLLTSLTNHPYQEPFYPLNHLKLKLVITDVFKIGEGNSAALVALLARSDPLTQSTE